MSDVIHNYPPALWPPWQQMRCSRDAFAIFNHAASTPLAASLPPRALETGADLVGALCAVIARDPLLTHVWVSAGARWIFVRPGMLLYDLLADRDLDRVGPDQRIVVAFHCEDDPRRTFLDTRAAALCGSCVAAAKLVGQLQDIELTKGRYNVLELHDRLRRRTVAPQHVAVFVPYLDAQLRRIDEATRPVLDALRNCVCDGDGPCASDHARAVHREFQLTLATELWVRGAFGSPWPDHRAPSPPPSDGCGSSRD